MARSSLLVSQPLLAAIKAKIESLDADAKVVLFGSRARQSHRPDSDWDILILTPHTIDMRSEQRFRHALMDVEMEYGQPISTFVFSVEEWQGKQRNTPLYYEISQEGIVL